MNEYFDPQLSKNFRNAINESPIFIYDEQYKNHYNLACAVMDRLDTCIEYLNKNIEYPKTEVDFLSFMMFSCMLTDAVKQILKDINIEVLSNESKYFRGVCLGSPLELSDEKCPTDDKFFEYFRSLTFAHPFKTNRPKFFKKDEIQYSPWVIVNPSLKALHKIPDAVGVRIYSNKRDDISDLLISFTTLKEYVKSRYECIVLATKWVKNAIAKEMSRWRKQKVNRNQEPICVFKDVLKTLESRYVKAYEIKVAINYLECKCTVEANSNAVNKYRNAIIKTIPDVCSAIENLDDQLLANIMDKVIYVRPANMHTGAHYQLEKIFSYLIEDSYNEWGLKQAQSFADAFAKKWVIIKPYEMSNDEIKLLVRTACYLEQKDQEK